MISDVLLRNREGGCSLKSLKNNLIVTSGQSLYQEIRAEHSEVATRKSQIVMWAIVKRESVVARESL